jgi:hypothetical protein
VGVVRNARVDLDRHPSVDSAGVLEDRAQDVARPANIDGHQVANHAVDCNLAEMQLVKLFVICGALLERLREDSGVAGDPDDVFGVHQVLQVPAL